MPPERSMTHQSGILRYATVKVTLVETKSIPCALKSHSTACAPSAVSVSPESADATDT